MKDVEVIIPWFTKLSDPDREAALTWCIERWTALGYGPPAVSRCSSERFCKAKAVTAAVESSRASWVVVADADVAPPADMQRAIAKVRWDCEPWAKPYTNVYRLNKESTTRWFNKEHVDLDNIHSLTEKPYIGIPGGGIVVISKENYLRVPLDPRFVGWGSEDESWGFALHTILGPPWIGMSDLIHFWHEPQGRVTRQYGSEEGKALRSRYMSAISKPEKMQRLVNEGK